MPLRANGGLVSRVFASIIFSAGIATAQQTNPVLDSLISRNSATFTLTDGRMSGLGAEQIITAARGAHFVVIGENHNTRAIPELTVALFRDLHARYGFNYLALEEGPALGRQLSQAVRGGKPDGAFRLGLRFPNAFHMYTEEELRMIDRVGAISNAKKEPIWGLNQEFGMLHVLERLIQIAPTASARAAADQLRLQAVQYEAERFAQNVFFLAAVMKPADFGKLRNAYRPAPGSEADRLIRQVELSNAIYAPYNTKPTPSFLEFYESGKAREENMKRLFAQNYREAMRTDGGPPKVLVKSGHVHVNRGLGRSNETFTLGNFLSELATFNEAHALNLYVLLNWQDLPQSFLAPFVPHIVTNTNTVFDLRPLQPWAAQQRLEKLHPELRRALVGYDFLIILNDMTPGSVEKLRTPRFRQYTN
jgi:hypothetical protein